MFIKSMGSRLRFIALSLLVFLPITVTSTTTYGIANELGLDLTCVTPAQKEHLLATYQQITGVSPFDEAGQMLVPSDGDIYGLKILLAELYAVTEQAGAIWTWRNPNPDAILTGVQVFGNILTVYASDQSSFFQISAALRDAAKSWSFGDQVHFIHQTEKDHVGIHTDFSELEEVHSHVVYPTEQRQSMIDDLVLGTWVTHKLLTLEEANHIASYMQSLDHTCRTGS